MYLKALKAQVGVTRNAQNIHEKHFFIQTRSYSDKNFIKISCYWSENILREIFVEILKVYWMDILGLYLTT